MVSEELGSKSRPKHDRDDGISSQNGESFSIFSSCSALSLLISITPENEITGITVVDDNSDPTTSKIKSFIDWLSDQSRPEYNSDAEILSSSSGFDSRSLQSPISLTYQPKYNLLQIGKSTIKFGGEITRLNISPESIKVTVRATGNLVRISSNSIKGQSLTELDSHESLVRVGNDNTLSGPLSFESETSVGQNLSRQSVPTKLNTLSRSSSVESIASSLFSLASGSSMSSTTSTHGAGDRLINLLHNDAVLYLLYQEALVRIAASRFERNLQRLFKMFSVDLRIEARHEPSFNSQVVKPEPPLEGQGDISGNSSSSDDQIEETVDFQQLQAFIVGSRAFESLKTRIRLFIYPNESTSLMPPPAVIDVARGPKQSSLSAKVEEFESKFTSEESMIHLEAQKAMIISKIDDRYTYQIFEGKETKEESRIAETVRGTLFLKPEVPRDNVEFNFKNFSISVKNVTENIDLLALFSSKVEVFEKLATIITSWWSIFLRHSRSSVKKVDLMLRLEPPIQQGMKRIRWECKDCGKPLYDDFLELERGAAQRLENSLNHREGGSNADLRSRISFRNVYNTLSSAAAAIKCAFEKKGPELLQHCPQSGSIPQSNDPPPRPTEPLYLLLCHNDGTYAKKLLQLSICDLKSDKKLFTVLRKNYYDMHSRWRSFFSFHTLTGIKFVKFELYKSQLVDIQQKDAIPPPPPHRAGYEYSYKPIPPDLIPPVGENHLMHLFQHPQHAEDEPVCLERFPKRLRDRLVVCNGQQTGLGWGLHLEEGLDTKKTWVVAFVTFVLGSFLFGILWAVFEKSIQDAFAISCWMIAGTTLAIGFTQAIVGRSN